MFQSRPEHYDTNMRQAPSVHATLATLTPPNGAQVPAVAIFKSKQVACVLPIADALRLANEIADSISAHNRTTN
jgi:hypothetical protein